jgi:hypothetical protein
MRYKLISCEVLFREMCDSVARSRHQVDVEFLPKGLHDLGGKAMKAELQRRVDDTKAAQYDAVLMGYALCGNGLKGLEAREIPLVAPRAHDCIALLMGSRAKYNEFFNANPGTYYRSTGWLERGKGLNQMMMDRTGVTVSLDSFIEKYGEDNGRFLFEEMTRYKTNYKQMAFIETGVEPDDSFEKETRREAVEAGWEFVKVQGNLDFFRRLVNGEWNDEDFLVAQPGERIETCYDDRVIQIERTHS